MRENRKRKIKNLKLEEVKVPLIGKEEIIKKYADTILEINTRFSKLSEDIDRKYNEATAVITKSKMECIKSAQELLKKGIEDFEARKAKVKQNPIKEEEKKDV